MLKSRKIRKANIETAEAAMSPKAWDFNQHHMLQKLTSYVVEIDSRAGTSLLSTWIARA